MLDAFGGARRHDRDGQRASATRRFTVLPSTAPVRPVAAGADDDLVGPGEPTPQAASLSPDLDARVGRSEAPRSPAWSNAAFASTRQSGRAPWRCCYSSDSAASGRAKRCARTAPLPRSRRPPCAPGRRRLRARRGPALGRSASGRKRVREHTTGCSPVPVDAGMASALLLAKCRVVAAPDVPLWPRRRHFHRASDPAQGSAGAYR